MLGLASNLDTPTITGQKGGLTAQTRTLERAQVPQRSLLLLVFEWHPYSPPRWQDLDFAYTLFVK